MGARSIRAGAWRMLYFEPSWIHELQADITQGEDSRFALLAPVLRDPHIRGLFDEAFHCATRDESDLAETFLGFIISAILAMPQILHSPPSWPLRPCWESFTTLSCPRSAGFNSGMPAPHRYRVERPPCLPQWRPSRQSHWRRSSWTTH